MKRSVSIHYQIAAWSIYWLFLLLINVLYFRGGHYPKPLLVLWTILFTLFGAGLFYILTRIYRRLMNQSESKPVLFVLSIILSSISAYIWGLGEPIFSWLINPEIHELNMKWDINSRGTISLTFLMAFFSFLYFFSQYHEDSSNRDVTASDTGEDKNAAKLTVTVCHKNSILLLPLVEIKKISISGNYSTILDVQNRIFNLKKSLKTWEDELDTDNFLRIHRSTIINRQFIEKIDLWHNYALRIKMIGIDAPEEVSRRYAAPLKKRLNI